MSSFFCFDPFKYLHWFKTSQLRAESRRKKLVRISVSRRTLVIAVVNGECRYIKYLDFCPHVEAEDSEPLKNPRTCKFSWRFQGFPKWPHIFLTAHERSVTAGCFPQTLRTELSSVSSSAVLWTDSRPVIWIFTLQTQKPRPTPSQARRRNRSLFLAQSFLKHLWVRPEPNSFSRVFLNPVTSDL